MAAAAIYFEWPYLRNGSRSTYSAHRAVIFAIAQFSCSESHRLSVSRSADSADPSSVNLVFVSFVTRRIDHEVGDEMIDQNSEPRWRCTMNWRPNLDYSLRCVTQLHPLLWQLQQQPCLMSLAYCLLSFLSFSQSKMWNMQLEQEAKLSIG